ncbi:cytochrome P450 4V3 [Pseudomassariella vexata]|uniref:Cytochrome P450 4V3 n=1 Tax=Pseudomassariella vexata TaxID=1141098 RepID=A0A1Y2DET5_9PEZI|nr:cytochrome P450 4V3 [Pseudomassariella vexata]ORY57790.1 cytochrome P450 4V3 [Pseudomassariella vexata]
MDTDVHEWACVLLITLGLLVATVVTVQLLYQTYVWRSRFRKMKAQGIPIMEGHSWILGHLLVMGKLRQGLPRRAHPNYLSKAIIENYKTLFPGETHCPPMVYIDFWPVEAPTALMLHPDVSKQCTQEKNYPRFPNVKNYMQALTGAKDLISSDGEEWRLWRSRLNPGFSARNVMSLIPAMLEEATIFVENLQRLAGKDGQWGDVFQLQDVTTDLTLDIIGRATLDIRFNEQTRGPGPVKTALVDTISHMYVRNMRTFLRWSSPWRHYALWRNNRIMRSALELYVREQIRADTHKKTVVNLVLKVTKVEQEGNRNLSVDSKFIDGVINQLKLFLFAGHDTTATTICWCFHNLEKYPVALQKLRKEHNTVLGEQPNPEAIADVLHSSPHLLNSLPYTLAVVKETLRLYPGPGTVRLGLPGWTMSEPNARRTLPTDGLMLWDGILGIHTHPDLWPHPKEFIPERWLVPEADPLYPPKHGWRPFSQGIMNCIGQELAMMEMKIVLALSVRQVDVRSAWDEWDAKLGGNAVKDTYEGDRAYQTALGTPQVKDRMPVRVRVRQ